MDAFYGAPGREAGSRGVRWRAASPGSCGTRMVSRLCDLAAAYRQLARAPTHASLAMRCGAQRSSSNSSTSAADPRLLRGRRASAPSTGTAAWRREISSTGVSASGAHQLL